jgi:hypothetical protein
MVHQSPEEEKNSSEFFEFREVRQNLEEKKNSSEFFECAPSGTTEGFGEDFPEKIFDCGGVHHMKI